MRHSIEAVYLDGVSFGIPQFRIILRQLNGSGLDRTFHCSARQV